MKIREVLMHTAETLKKADVLEYQNDAWLLFEYVFEMNRTQYFLKMNDLVETVENAEEKLANLLELAEKRSRHIPLQYLLGHQVFMGLDFLVSEAVLIPRQDTEILVEHALSVCEKLWSEKHCIAEHGDLKILDMCTGSGCIAISVKKLGEDNIAGQKKHRKSLQVTAVDLSLEALKIAKQNAGRNECDIIFVQSDLFQNLPEQKFDVILSNPPYIKSEEIRTLMEEVRCYEPHMALDGDKDGLKFYRAITKQAADFLNAGGYLIYEIGCEQAEEVSALMKNNGFTDIVIKKDLAGLDRVVSGKYMSLEIKK